MLPIVSVPNPVLTTPVAPVTDFGPNLEKLIKHMKETLEAQTNPQGVGLAAPQVGVNKAVFIIKPTKTSSIEVFVNPEILEYQTPNGKIQPKNSKRKKRNKLEGCLSIPRIWGPVKRAMRVKVKYQTPNTKHQTRWFGGFKAVIIQHEMDHLRGVLFTQRVLEQKGQLYEEKEGKLEKIDY